MNKEGKGEAFAAWAQVVTKGVLEVWMGALAKIMKPPPVSIVVRKRPLNREKMVGDRKKERKVRKEDSVQRDPEGPRLKGMNQNRIPWNG